MTLTGAPIQILSTKILDEAIIQQAASENIFIDCIPFIEIRNVETAGLQQNIIKALTRSSHVIFTSANAVNAVAKQLYDKPGLNVFCISGKTRRTIETQFPGSTIIDDAPNGAELADKIIRHKIDSAVFFCGNKRLDTIPDRLRGEEISLLEIIVYETILIPQKIEKKYDGILFFSPSAVESLFSMNRPAQNVIAFAIGNTTSKALHKYNLKVVNNNSADIFSLIYLVKEYFNSHEPLI